MHYELDFRELHQYNLLMRRLHSIWNIHHKGIFYQNNILNKTFTLTLLLLYFMHRLHESSIILIIERNVLMHGTYFTFIVLLYSRFNVIVGSISQLAIGQTQAVAVGTTNRDTNVGTATNVGVKTNVTNMEKTGAAAFGNATVNIQGDVPIPSSSSEDEDSSGEDD